MHDRLVFDDDFSHNLQLSLRSIGLERQGDHGHVYPASASAAAALEEFVQVFANASNTLYDNVDALARFLNDSAAELRSVDQIVATSLPKPTSKL